MGETTTLEDNPAYEEWFARDQQVLGFLFSALSKEVMVQVAAAKTAAQAWKMIQDTFVSHTRARVMNVRLALNTTKKESMTITEFYTKMTALGDELAAAGKPLDDAEMISYIVNGLDSDYNPLVSGIVARVDPITLSEFHSQLLSFDTRLEMQQGGSGSSVNSASRGGRGGGRGRGFQSHGRGNNNQGRGNSRGRGNQHQRSLSNNHGSVIAIN